MMKKFLYSIASVLILSGVASGQDKKEDKQEEFDKKFRFGLRVAAQPSWFTSNDNNNKPYGAVFGYGFGLNMEYRFSKIVALSTGIGADFEGGKYTFRSDPQGNYQVRYWMNNGAELIEPKGKKTMKEMNNASNIMYVLEERLIKTTHVTLPAILKLSTNEYSGMKYFGMFGGEIGIRIKSVATDKYLTSYKYDANGFVTNGTSGDGPSEQSNINLSKDASLVPMRIGFNAGLGLEYRLGGSTSAFFSLNYFRSFTNLMRGDSKYMIYNVDDTDPNNVTFFYVKQNYIQNALRINLGILF